MLKTYKNTKKQGDAGLGAAIAYFTALGIGVLVPLTDSQSYDLVIDDGVLRKVQVKTTTYKTKAGHYSVSLTVKGGNRSGAGRIARFDHTDIDYLFVLSPEQTYLIPSRAFAGKQSIVLGSQFASFIVKGC